MFREGIDIEDTMSVMVRYRTGVMMSYSLNAFCPGEGYRASITGDAGRIEYVEHHASHIITGARDIVHSPDEENTIELVLHKHFQPSRHIDIPKTDAPHGGGDPVIQEQIFSANPPTDIFSRNAGHEQGAASLLVGAAANQAIATGRLVHISDLIALRPEASHLSELV